MAYEHKKPSSVAEAPDLFTVYTFKGSALVRSSNNVSYALSDEVAVAELAWCNGQSDPAEYSVLCIGVNVGPARAEIVGVISPTGYRGADKNNSGARQ